MRRCPSLTNTIAATMRIASIPKMTMLSTLPSSRRVRMALGACERIETVIMSEMPFPRPCWRSEERRVGKECRSLCDWSSDVCSSDLVEHVAVLQEGTDGVGRLREDRDRYYERDAVPEAVLEIGRASCRERV